MQHPPLYKVCWYCKGPLAPADFGINVFCEECRNHPGDRFAPTSKDWERERAETLRMEARNS